MTAGRDALHARLVEVLDGEYGSDSALIAALLPVVEAHAREAAVQALWDTALAWQYGAWIDMPASANPIANGQYVTGWLRARASALTEETDQ